MPIPPSPCLAHDVDWRQLVLALDLVPADRCAWLVRDIIATAAAVCGRGNTHPLLAAKVTWCIITYYYYYACMIS